MTKCNYKHLLDKFLQGNCDLAETNLLAKWIGSNSFEDWSKSVWDDASSEMDETLCYELYTRIKTEIESKETLLIENKSRKRKNIYKIVAQVAAILILVFITGLVTIWSTEEKMILADMDIIVERGQKVNVKLPDGSSVWLNSDSKLTYGSQFNNEIRVMHLQGEAYFEVAPNPKASFVVKTDHMTVRALGTSFDIRAYGDDSQTSAILITGKLEVQTGDQTFILESNEGASFDKKSRTTTKNKLSNSLAYAGWRSDALYFDAAPLEEIMKILARNYNIDIQFETESLKQYKVKGTLKNTSLDNALQILKLTIPMTYDTQGSTIVLREDKNLKFFYDKALK